jgi:hypothetical protein
VATLASDHQARPTCHTQYITVLPSDIHSPVSFFLLLLCVGARYKFFQNKDPYFPLGLSFFLPWSRLGDKAHGRIVDWGSNPRAVGQGDKGEKEANYVQSTSSSASAAQQCARSEGSQAGTQVLAEDLPGVHGMIANRVYVGCKTGDCGLCS